MTAEQTKASLTLTVVVKPRAADVLPTAIARRTVIARVMSALMEFAVSSYMLFRPETC
jgi:hypothetical protein